MLDLESPNVTAQIRRIVGLLESKPHLFAKVLCMPPPCWRDTRLAAEFGVTNPTMVEDEGMKILIHSDRDTRIQALSIWLDKGFIDIDQLVFMANICGINPQEFTR